MEGAKMGENEEEKEDDETSTAIDGGGGLRTLQRESPCVIIFRLAVCHKGLINMYLLRG